MLNLDKKIEKTKGAFPQAFLNEEKELILHKKSNTFFRVDNIETELDFDCKIISYCTYGATHSQKKYFKNGLEKYFGISFTQKELEKMYDYLGNGINKELCKKFITEDFNFKILEF